MKLYIAQMKILPGNVQANMQTMKSALDRARAADADCIFNRGFQPEAVLL